MTELPSAGHAIGRYVLSDEIAAGGMATVHIGRLVGVGGFARTVAIKRLHRHLANDEELVAMLLDEARVTSRVRHPSVVSTLDVVPGESELLLVMEYVHGESLSGLLRVVRKRDERVPMAIATAIILDVLDGLHAAHEARDELGRPLNIVHRDVSPQNVIVGVDGVARVLDFGIAKAHGRMQDTRSGEIKGKLAYIAPEQFSRKPITRRADIYAATIVYWQTLTAQPLFEGGHDAAVVEQILYGSPRSARAIVPEISPTLDAILMRGLARDPEQRFPTAKEMALAIAAECERASRNEVSAWVEANATDALEKRARLIASIEGGTHRIPSASAAVKEIESGSGPRVREPDTDPIAHEITPPTSTLQATSTLVTKTEVDEPAAPGRSRLVIGALLLGGSIAAGAMAFAVRPKPTPPTLSSSVPVPVPVPASLSVSAPAPIPAQEPSAAPSAPSGSTTSSASSAPPPKQKPPPTRAPTRPARPALPKGLPGERT